MRDLNFTSSSPLAPIRSPDDIADSCAVVAGLRADPPHLSPKWLYDGVGSALFEAITRCNEYYPTRCEMEIYRTHAASIGKELGPNLSIVELGSGSAQKIAALLPHLQKPHSYHPIDVSASALAATVSALAASYPTLTVLPFLGDFTQKGVLPHFIATSHTGGSPLIYFPGSTLGNFDADAAHSLLLECSRSLREDTPFLVGIDLVKERSTLEAAYNDAAGITAAFNRNVLAHLNRRFAATFDVSAWNHEAHWNAQLCRIEMWLRSQTNQIVKFGGTSLYFAKGNAIHTESSYKWDLRRFSTLVQRAGWAIDGWWTDSQGWFAEVLMRRRASPGSSSLRAFVD